MSINLDLYDDIELPVNGSGGLDPNKIRLSVWTPTVDVVLKMLDERGMELPEDIDRSSFWDLRAESRLLESLLIKIPLPAFYVDGTREDRLTVVDGLYRLRAIKRYMRDDAFALEGLDYLKELEGKPFKDLKRPLQRRLEESSITIHRIEAGTSEAAKFNIIRRIQSGAAALSAQEIRAMLNPGPGCELLHVLARHEEFQAMQPHPASLMADEELLLLFILGPHKEAHEDNLREILQKLNDDISFREEQSQRFLRSFPAARNHLAPLQVRRLPRRVFLNFLFAVENGHADPESLIEEYRA